MSERPFDAESPTKHPEDSSKNVKPITTDSQAFTSDISEVKLLPICETPLSIEWYTDWNEVAANNCGPDCSNPLHNHK